MNQRSAKWWVLTAMCLIMMMLAIDGTALNIAIPVISHEFGASLTNMQWVINAFFLLAAMVQIAGGHFGDSYGHRKIFLGAVFLFILSSAGSGFAVNEEMLIAFRAIQGASVGVATPLTFTLVAEAFPTGIQSFARSFLVMTMGIGLAVGAPLGGFFVHTLGWRWIFYINIPIGLACYALTALCSRPQKPHPKPFDKKGIAFLLITLFLITFAFNQMQVLGVGSIGFLVAGLIFLYLLYRNERIQADPMVDFLLFKNRRFLLNNLIRTVNQLIFLGLLFFLPLYLQNIALVSPIVSGLTMLTLTFVICVLSPSIGKWIDREGEERANILAMLLFLGASLLLLFVQETPNFYLLSTLLFLCGIAVAILYNSTTTGALSVASPEKLGRVSGLFLTVVWLGCALGVSFSGTAIAAASGSTLHARLRDEQIFLSPDELALATRTAQGLSPISSLEPKLQEICSAAFTGGIHANGWMFLAFSLSGLILALLFRSGPLKGRSKSH